MHQNIKVGLSILSTVSKVKYDKFLKKGKRGLDCASTKATDSKPRQNRINILITCQSVQAPISGTPGAIGDVV